MRPSRFLIAGLVTTGLFAVSGCDDKKKVIVPDAPANNAGAGSNAVPNGADAGKPAAGTGADAVANTGKVQTGYVLYTTTVKKEPSEKQKLDDATGKGKANWIATLYRGEKVSVLSENDEYAQVRTSGEQEGWMKKGSVLSQPDVLEATVVEPTDAFDRPDLLALNAKKKIAPGTLVFITKTREQFSEVNAGGTSTVWVLTARLVRDTTELSVAKIFAKMKSLKDAKQEGADELFNLAKTNFSASRLVAAIEAEHAAAASAPVVGTPATTGTVAAEPSKTPQ